MRQNEFLCARSHHLRQLVVFEIKGIKRFFIVERYFKNIKKENSWKVSTFVKQQARDAMMGVEVKLKMKKVQQPSNIERAKLFKHLRRFDINLISRIYWNRKGAAILHVTRSKRIGIETFSNFGCKNGNNSRHTSVYFIFRETLQTLLSCLKQIYHPQKLPSFPHPKKLLNEKNVFINLIHISFSLASISLIIFLQKSNDKFIYSTGFFLSQFLSVLPHTF